MRVYLPIPGQPPRVTLTNSKGQPVTSNDASWDAASGTYFLSFDNDPDGVSVDFDW
jgi:hypothetical protein